MTACLAFAAVLAASSPTADIGSLGEFGIEKIVASYPKAFGDHVGSELWNTEGNIFGASSFYSWRYNRADGARRGDRGGCSAAG